MQIEFLQKLGLTKGEIKTYLSLLKMGSSSTGPLAQDSQVSRSKLYGILDKLEKKGLVSHIEKQGVTYFQAVEPAKIQDYIREKQLEINELKEEFEKFLPELQSYQESKKMQRVTVYQGTRGLIAAHEHTYLKLKKGEEYYYMGIPKNQPLIHEIYWKRDHVRRIKAGIKCKLLFNKDAPREILDARNSFKGCEARYMPVGIKTPAYFLIYKDTIMIAMPVDDPLVIEIINQEIADAFLVYFWEFWKRSKV